MTISGGKGPWALPECHVGKTLTSKKLEKLYQKILYTVHPNFPNVNISHNQKVVVTAGKLTWIRRGNLVCRLASRHCAARSSGPGPSSGRAWLTGAVSPQPPLM